MLIMIFKYSSIRSSNAHLPPGVTDCRHIWHQLIKLVFFLSLSMNIMAGEEGIRIGLTPVFLDNKTSFLRELEGYFEWKLHMPVTFVQRHSYREITDLLVKERIDVAWICGYPYVNHSDQLRLLAVPIYNGEPLYQSYLIVPSGDEKTVNIEDLRNSVFAYSDPDSNSGFLVPQVKLLEAGIKPKYFFSKVFFTWSHRDVVVAVAEGLAQGGAVDGYVWDTLAKSHPDLTKRTRVVTKSEKFGFPPFAARLSLPEPQFHKVQKILFGMSEDTVGSKLLTKLNIDGFTKANADLFDSILSKVEIFAGQP